MVVRYERPLRPDELMHFGILGMKWGVRRYQNEDGTWKNSEARARHLKQDRKSKASIGDKARSAAYRLQNKGMSKEEADEYAKKNGETIKKIATAAGIAVGVSAAVYLGRQMSKTQFDRVIKQGMKVSTLNMNPDVMKYGKDFYAMNNPLNQVKIKDMFGATKSKFMGFPIKGSGKQQIVGEVAKDIKVAGRGTSNKAFKKLMREDKDFKESVDRLIKSSGKGKGIQIGSKYNKFNKKVLYKDGLEVNSVKNKFYGELSKQGYGGVADLRNGRNGLNSGSNIIFDKSAIGNTTAKNINAKEVLQTKRKNLRSNAINIATNPATVGAVGATAYGIANVAAAKKTKKQYKRKQR